jgi:hypothetical protein
MAEADCYSSDAGAGRRRGEEWTGEGLWGTCGVVVGFYVRVFLQVL